MLDGRPATTHWMRTEPFRSFFPEVRLDPDVLYVDDGDVLTSAGQRRRDRPAACTSSGATTAPRSRTGWRGATSSRRGATAGQSQFSQGSTARRIRCGRRAPVPAPGVGAARTFALANLGEPLPLHRLAGHAAMSVRTFTRRFRDETGQSPHTWLAEQRVALARRLLETTELPVERIAADAGFGTAASLRQHLRAAIGVAPGAYRRMYRGPRV